MNLVKERITYCFNNIKLLLKWLVIALVVGVLGGVVGSFFHISVDLVTEFRQHNKLIILFLPVGGVIITLLYRICKKWGHIDTNRVIEAVNGDGNIPFVMTPLIFVSTVITHLFGGSAGREGAALQLGGSIAYRVGKIFKLNKNDLHIIVMSGMSAVFAALFGTPITAMFFALEVTSVGVMHYASMVPCIIASSSAYFVALIFKIPPVRFSNIAVEAFTPATALKVIILAILCAIVGIIFCVAIKKCEHYMEKLMPNGYVRAFVGGLIIVALTYVFRTTDYNGAGMDVISRAISGEAKYEAFILKIIFTAVTISAGFKGGEIVPTFFIGSTFGCVMGYILGLDPSFAAAIGFVTLFCSVVNCPVASFVLAVEVFGVNSILLFAIALSISYMMSGYGGLYKSQKFMFSKTEMKQIDITAK